MESAEHPARPGNASRGVLTMLAVATGFGLAANGIWTAANLRSSLRLDRREADLASRQQALQVSTWRAVELARPPIAFVPLGARVSAPIAVPEILPAEPERAPLVACVTVRSASGTRVYAVRDPLLRVPAPGDETRGGAAGLVVRRRAGPPVRIADGHLLASLTTYVPASRCPADVVY